MFSSTSPTGFYLCRAAQTGAKALITIPLKFKFVFEACALSSPAISFSHHVLDGVELISKTIKASDVVMFRLRFDFYRL